MFVDIIIGNPAEILPKKLLDELELLVPDNTNSVASIIAQIKAIHDNETRIFALLFIDSLEIEVDYKRQIFSEFLFDSSSDIQYHMVLFVGKYTLSESISALQTIKNTSDGLNQCTAIWSLAKLDYHDGLTNQIIEIFPKVKNERALALLAVALYLVNNNANSQEMLFLKDYFLANCYDEEKQHFFPTILQTSTFSPELIAHLLWQVGYKFVEFHSWNSLDIDWLINDV